ncbi:MAG: c-type cytochrome [Bryobacterales bacterium]|nr:c-type cytochrome [Bryobacterales bacterium]
MLRSSFVCLAAAGLLLASCSREAAPSRYKVPKGFTVESALPQGRTVSLIQVTFDSLGRPVVSQERGHPTILIDQDGDGVFETEKIFSDKVEYLHGMWFAGRTLYAIGNDTVNKQAGLYRLEDTDGDDVADTFEMLHTFTGRMGEHGPHDIRRGPDGHPTVMLGNHTFVEQELIDPSSPYRDYDEVQLLPSYNDARGHAANIRAPGGVLLRLNVERNRYTLLFGGFRNAFNHAYNRDGEAFTFDSDMEWDINMPWYRAVRTVHGVPGADYGWRTGSAKLPDYSLDTLPPVREAGRGSPVGVEFYQHRVYPKAYWDAFLEGDWSRGRILISQMVRQGASYRTDRPDPVDFVYGEPLNVTDLEVGPDGFVYFTTGGRDTEGGFYRIRYTPSWWEKLTAPKEPTGLLAVVRQPQPLSSWGHAALETAKESMGDAWGRDLAELAKNASAEPADRVQALLLLERLGPKPNADLLRPLAADPDPSVRAAAILVVGMHRSDRAKAIAVSGLPDADPFVRRRAAESIVRMGLSADQPSFAPVDQVYALLNDDDRFVRYAGRLALERIPRQEWQAKALDETDSRAAIEAMVALTRTAQSDADLEPVFSRQLNWFKRTDLSSDDLLRLLRAHHLTAIKASKGAPEALRKEVSDLLLARFPHQDERLNRELARTLAYCGQPEAISAILKAMPRGDENQQLQIHYAYCLRTMQQGWTPEDKQQLIHWFPRAAKWRGGASFTGFINLLFDSSLAFMSKEEKELAYQRVPEFAPVDPKQLDERQRSQVAVVQRRKGVEAVSPEEIFEFQMYDPMTLKASAEAGRKVFEAECANCHRHGDLGKDFGPDLTTLAARFKKQDVLEAILWPSKTVSDQYQSWIVETKSGDTINGLLVSEAGGKLVLKTAEVERPIDIPAADVREKRISQISIMPDNLLDGYRMNDISDLMAFLMGTGRKAAD